MYQHGSLAATGAASGAMMLLGYGVAGVVLGLALLVLAKLLRRKKNDV